MLTLTHWQAGSRAQVTLSLSISLYHLDLVRSQFPFKYQKLPLGGGSARGPQPALQDTLGDEGGKIAFTSGQARVPGRIYAPVLFKEIKEWRSKITYFSAPCARRSYSISRANTLILQSNWAKTEELNWKVTL